jgi:cell division protein FtsN
MKRFLLVLFAGLLLNIHVFAQYDDYDYNYDDYASNDYASDDYGSNDYSSNDYGSETKSEATSPSIVTNDGSQGYSEQKLTLPNNQPIYLYFYNTVQNPASPEPAAQNTPPAQSAPPPREPDPIVEYRYVPPPVSTPPPPEPIYIPAPQPQIEYIYIQPPAPQVEYIYIQPPAQPQVEYLPPPMVEPIAPPPVEPVYFIQSPTQIRVIPGLPNPNSSRIYCLQVGSYAVHNTAEKMAQRIRSAGLQANVESYNSLKRVVVPGVRASDAYSIVQMLESMGFQEVWVRE